MNANELRGKSAEELNSTLIEQRKELFNLRIQKTTGQLSQTHLIKEAKRNIARIKTLLNEQAQ